MGSGGDSHVEPKGEGRGCQPSEADTGSDGGEEFKKVSHVEPVKGKGGAKGVKKRQNRVRLVRGWGWCVRANGVVIADGGRGGGDRKREHHSCR
jgi:hypothetical protein